MTGVTQHVRAKKLDTTSQIIGELTTVTTMGGGEISSKSRVKEWSRNKRKASPCGGSGWRSHSGEGGYRYHV